jgi:predicted lipoprotein with Yx(FWY)xxD motif
MALRMSPQFRLLVAGHRGRHDAGMEVPMKKFRRFERLVVGPATAAMLILGLIAVPVGLSSPANAQSAKSTSSSCTTPVTSAPTGPATVGTASTPFGRVLVIGSGANEGCSLYVLTSDQLHALTFGLASFACSDGPNSIGHPCDSVLWPALLTKGEPIAGPGVNRNLLGTVARTDVLSGNTVQQVTYAGLPLYRFFLDETPGQTDGANLFDPVTSPTGTWYLVEPDRGHPAPGRLQMPVETASGMEVLAASMDNDFSLLPHGSFPVYTLSNTNGQTCGTYCSLIWPPVLTSGQPQAGRSVEQHALGVVVRTDGTRQVTYKGKPLYLFIQDAYIPGVVGTKSINGAGAVTPWGEFNPIPLP